MTSKIKSTNTDDEDLGNAVLLRDLKEISQALYLHKSLPKAINSSIVHCPGVAAKAGILASRNKLNIQDSLHKDKKPSRWSWKPLKALTQARDHRFNCCFFIDVHSIEGLSSTFNGLTLCVTWKRKGKMLKTLPVRVCVGMAEFEETLMHRCAVYGNRNGPHNSAKYEPKLFLLHASVIGAPAFDIGKHWIDLTRLLPVTLEELEGEERSSGKWTTSFKLTGKAAGAMLNVSFGFSMMDDNSFKSGCFMKVPNVEKEHGLTIANYIADVNKSCEANQLIDVCQVPTISTKALNCQYQSLGIKFLDEVFPNHGSDLARSLSLLYREFSKEKMCNAIDFDFVREHFLSLKLKATPSLEHGGGSTEHEVNDTEFNVIENDREISKKDQVKIEQHGSQRFDSSLIEIIDVAEIFGEDIFFDDNMECDTKLDTDYHDEIPDMERTENIISIKEPAVKELEGVLSDMKTSGSAKLDSFLEINKFHEQEKSMKTQSWHTENKLTKLLGLDDDAESIENDFLNMLCAYPSQDDIIFNSSIESPRDLLLRQFEEDSLTWRNDSLRYGRAAWADDFDMSSTILTDNQNHGSVTDSLKSKGKAKSIENLETEALMHEWGLNEKAFQNSPCASSGGFGSPVYIPPEEPLKLPSLGEGLGPIIQTKDGGFLRSMSPLLFRNVNGGSRLIVQVSAPVVLPVTMGLTIMELLQCWASRGIKKMSIQVNELMPLEDITEKTKNQVVPNAESVSEVFKRWDLHPKSEKGEESTNVKKAAVSAQNSDTLLSSHTSKERDSDGVSFENLVPLALTNVEGLLIEGLKIQSGMSDNEAPSRIGIHFVGSSAAGKSTEPCGNFNAESASDLKVVDVDELVHYSVPLEEWLRRESKYLFANNETDENVLKYLASHHTGSLEVSSGRQIMVDESTKNLDRNYGDLNSKFIMGLKVQLRDPLRDNEMVGSSMLALIEVEKVCSTNQHCTSKRIRDDVTAVSDERLIQGVTGFGQRKSFIPLFKVSAVYLAGLHAILGSKELWGTNKQQQAGSRWLLSSGMLRTSKNHILNSNPVIKFSSRGSRMPWSGDVCWSISSCIQGEATLWNEKTSLDVHVRNPDIIFPLESANVAR